MHVLWLLTRDLDATGEEIRAEQARLASVETIDLRAERDAGRVLDAIEAADKSSPGRGGEGRA